MATHLGFFPPCPSEGPLSMLDLPPDDWCIEAKLDGCRVILAGGEVWTRQGTPLAASKGADRLRILFAILPAFPVEGEWVAKEERLYLFDLPDDPGPYDERRRHLERLVESLVHDRPRLRSWLCLAPQAWSEFRRFYADWRGRAEGVVLKRRASLYQKCARPNTETRDWLKRRYSFDLR